MKYYKQLGAEKLNIFPPLSLYIHLPWCVQKCPYCDFNSHTLSDNSPIDAYLGSLIKDIYYEGKRVSGRIIETIFIGGGTPNVFNCDQLGVILEECKKNFNLVENCEITMECNPSKNITSNLLGFHFVGINRLSIGAQSFDNALLKNLGRIHGSNDIIDTYFFAREAGFENINLDLMYGLPFQDILQCERDLSKAIKLDPEHISFYQLTIEENTVFYKSPPEGMPTSDETFEMQNLGFSMFSDANYNQYEVSAFAKNNFYCLHNLNYWRFGDYVGIGAGAHGKITNKDGSVIRTEKVKNPREFIKRFMNDKMPVSNKIEVSKKDLIFEFMLNSLRLQEGISGISFNKRTGQDIENLKDVMQLAIDDGLLETIDEDHWRPTDHGFRFLNELQLRFLS